MHSRPFARASLALLVLSAVSLSATTSYAAEPPTIIPRPSSITPAEGEFRLTPETRIYVATEYRDIGEYLAERILHAVGVRPDVVTGAVDPEDPGIAIHDFLFRSGPPPHGESYNLDVKPTRIDLRAPTTSGAFRGVQTIRQLIGPEFLSPEAIGAPKDASTPRSVSIPCMTISDSPRYPHRGMLLDCCRHFMPKEFVKRYIDLLAYHKMNVLHWHLTEDQGWRIEIKKYPKLTEVGAWRMKDGKRYGGFYTQDDIREVVAYAASRYITVIPEIEMPGHSIAALASYPELSCTGGPFEVETRWGVFDDVYCAGNDRTFEFMQDVLTEVMELFPSTYIHIGGDECPKTRWKTCPKCQARIAAEGLKDEHELQSYFIQRIEKFLNGHGRRIIGWDEILEGGLAPNATVQSWRGMSGAIAAATAGHDVIASPTTHCYLDYAQGRNPGEPTNMGFVPLSKAYSFEPTPEELPDSRLHHVLGVQGNMWTEWAPPELVDRQVFPRLCALAEVGWSPKEARDWDDFSRRLTAHYPRLDALGVTYYIPPPFPKSEAFSFKEQTQLAFEPAVLGGEIRYTLDGADPTAASTRFDRPLTIDKTVVVKARTFLPNGRMSGPAELKYRKLVQREAVDAPATSAGLRYDYFEGDWTRVPDFAALKPGSSGVAAGVDLTPSKRAELFGLRFTGLVRIETEGVYTFHLKSDDGSRLRIGEEVVVDNDGRHAPLEISGQAWLKPGMHPIVVEYFNSLGRGVLELAYEGPGVTRQAVPGAALWREGE